MLQTIRSRRAGVSLHGVNDWARLVTVRKEGAMDKRLRFVPGIGRVLLWLGVLFAGVSLWPAAGAASSTVRTVGIVDFYVSSPLPSFEGVFPEQFAADDLTGLLTRAGTGRLAVTPRRVVERAEATMGWRNEDALRFGRLRALADSVGADQLVIGWITMLNVETGGSRGTGDLPTSDVELVVQIFDAAQGRIVAESRQRAYALFGGTRALLAEKGLHLALAPTVPWLIATLGLER